MSGKADFSPPQSTAVFPGWAEKLYKNVFAAGAIASHYSLSNKPSRRPVPLPLPVHCVPPQSSPPGWPASGRAATLARLLDWAEQHVAGPHKMRVVQYALARPAEAWAIIQSPLEAKEAILVQLALAVEPAHAPAPDPPPIPVPRVGLGYHWAILGVWVVHFGQPLLKIRPRCPFWVCC